MDKFAPKFCTITQIGVLNNKNIVLSMLYSEDNKQVSLIEKIVIDVDHAKQLVKILSEAIEKA